MTDRELLEAAAKAAGMTLGAWHEGRLAFMYRDASPGPGYWNPLTDDADALRLIVRCGLKLNICVGGGCVQVGGVGSYVEIDFDNDPYAATRRAIVRAAAEIGKGMK